MRNFSEWLGSFRESIATFDYYVDFNKVYQNIENIKIELNILNSLIGSKNIKNDFNRILTDYPKVIKCIPILLAVRANQIYARNKEDNNDRGIWYDFRKYSLKPDQYSYFLQKTGLFDLLEKHLISNLVDYVTGIETGLDSNGRKNRGGHLMEDLVEDFIRQSGFINGKDYFKEMYIQEIIKNWKINLSAISNKGKMEKRFDFVVKTEKQIYVIETNFYTGGGSKLNETARSYKTLAQEIDTIDGVTFVWFTDGKGWISARNNLEETFDVMEHIYNINDMENGIIEKIIK